MTWKKVNNADAGTSTKFGGNDLDKHSDWHSGVDVDDSDINSDFTVRSGKRHLRNPANTFSYTEVASAIAANRQITEPLLTGNDTRAYEAHTQTLTNKTMSNDSNFFPHVGGYNAIIYKSGSVYKAKKGDGTLIASNTVLDSVVQAALDLKGLIVWPAASDGTAYNPSVSLTGWELSTGTTLLLSYDTRVTMPEAFAGTVFKINDAYGGAHQASKITIQGGMFQQGGVAPDALWTFLHMQSSSSTPNNTGVFGCSFRDIYVKRCNIFIRLQSNTGTESWLNGNNFDSLWCDYPHEGIVFEQGAAVGVSKPGAINRNNFHNVVIQADQGETTGQYALLTGIKDISGVNNVFTNCKIWDIQSPNAASNISNKAENTVINGGLMAQAPYDWEVSKDFGVRTIVIGTEKSGGTGVGANTGTIRPDIRKTGMMVGQGSASANVQADGLLQGITTEGTVTSVRSVVGVGKRVDTTTTINTRARIATPASTTIRYWNPIYRTRISINQSTAQRVFVGFAESTVLTLHTAEDPLPNLVGFGLYHSTTSGVSTTNWLMCRNNGGASSTITDTGIPVVFSTPVNLWVALWEDGPKAQWRVGSSGVGEATTTIPGQTTGMVVGNWIGNTAAAAKTLDTFYMFLKNSKSEEWI